MINENKRVIEKIDKILNELSLQTNIILDGIQKIYSYVNDVEVHYIMENMFKSSITLSKYINDLLDYKKYLLTDNLELDTDNVNILLLIKKIFNIYNVKMESYNITFNYNLSNYIRENTFLIDKKYLTQIMLNVFDIIIADIESEITNLNNNKILIKVEYNTEYIEFNIYYTSTRYINIEQIKDNVFDKYNIKYNIINELVNHLKGDVLYYNEIGDGIGYDKQITIKLLSETYNSIDNIETDNNNINNKLVYKTKVEKKNITIAILSSNSLYLNIIINALDYYTNKIDLEIIPLDNIKKGFDYIKKNNKDVDILILDIEYNNLLGLNILNNLYKYKNLKFILTTSIETDNIKNYIGPEFNNNRIFIYIKPINSHNISKIENFLLDINDMENDNEKIDKKIIKDIDVNNNFNNNDINNDVNYIYKIKNNNVFYI